MTIEKKIAHLLSCTPDPQYALTCEELQIKHLLTYDERDIHLALRAGFPIGFIQDSLPQALQHACQLTFPQHAIHITLEQTIQAHQTQLPGQGLRGVKNTIAIASGKGGVGKSTVTVNLAVALARAGARVGILDADIYGPSIPLMLGITSKANIQGEHYLPTLAHGLQTMSIAYLTEDASSALIWRGPMLAKSLMHMINITLWDELDYLLIDLPPGTGDIQLSLVQKIPLAGAVIVTTPQNVATLDAQKALHMFEKTNIHALGLIENMSLHMCSQCGHTETIFGEGGAELLSQKNTCALLGQLPLDARIRQQCDQGTPSALSNMRDNLTRTFNTVALNAARALAQRPLNYANKFPPVVVR